MPGRSSGRVWGMLLAGLPLLASCAGQVNVSHVTSDKFGYLHSKFKLKDGPTGAVDIIKAQDSGNLSFQRMTFEFTGHLEVGQTGNSPPALHSTLTLINAGGPFVEALEEQSSNGIPTQENYSLRYRNLLAVREQTVPLNQRITSWIWDIKTLKSFVPLASSDPGSGSFDAEFESGNPMQIAGFQHLAIHCTYGATYPAATLNPKLSGNAQELACETDNNNGVPRSHSVRVLLRQYGITIVKHNETAAASVSMTIDDVRIE